MLNVKQESQKLINIFEGNICYTVVFLVLLAVKHVVVSYLSLIILFSIALIDF